MNQDANENVLKTKSRNLSIIQFYKILQLEAIVAELRCKIYSKIKDKNYWKGVYEHKKSTILDISSRNQVNNQPLPSIFSDDEIMAEYKKEIFGEGGYPKFIYKNLEQENSQSYYDHLNYYSKGADVSCIYFSSFKLGKVKHHQPQSKVVTVIFDDIASEVELPITDVTRII